MYPFILQTIFDHLLGDRHCEQLRINANVNSYKGLLLPAKVEQAPYSLHLPLMTFQSCTKGNLNHEP